MIIVTFGGGVRYSETFTADGERNIPRLVELRPSGYFFKNCANSGVLVAFQLHGQHRQRKLAARRRLRFSAAGRTDDLRTLPEQTRASAMDAWAIATNKSF